LIGGLSVPNVTASVLENETDFVTLVVVTKEERPYVMLNKGRTGNDAYDGFSIDLLKVKKFLQCIIHRYLNLCGSEGM
jgi:hypothetical protein